MVAQETRFGKDERNDDGKVLNEEQRRNDDQKSTFSRSHVRVMRSYSKAEAGVYV